MASTSDFADPLGQAVADAASRLSLVRISKRYPGVLANDDVSLDIAPGEIHGLIGENGAGKSTLMKIVYGLVAPDAGQIIWEGRHCQVASPAVARRMGIGMVFQHFSLLESLTVLENIALMVPRASADAALAARVSELGKRYGITVEAHRHVFDLSVGERQRVEIVRALMLSPRLLILDEPTSVLTPQAAQALFVTLRRLAGEGVSLLYISHRLDEVRQLCSRATVLRAGRVSGTCDPRRESVESLSRLMLGSAPPALTRPSTARASDALPRLLVQDLRAAPASLHGHALRVDSLLVRRGEIVGIAGVSGNGQGDLLDLLSGERLLAPTGHGAMRLAIDGADMRGLGVAQRRSHGLAFIPEERLGRATVPGMALDWNLLLSRREPAWSSWGFLRRRRLARVARRLIEQHQVRADGPGALAASLSGGNLQKYVVARELEPAPTLVLVAQPTWGVDVGAAARIHQALLDLRAAGAGVLLVSEDLDELFALCDAFHVISAGRLSGRLEAGQASIEQIGRLMGAIDDTQAA